VTDLTEVGFEVSSELFCEVGDISSAEENGDEGFNFLGGCYYLLRLKVRHLKKEG
jgi:hypothetical protein